MGKNISSVDELINEIFSKPIVVTDDKLDILLSDKKKETKNVYLSHIRKFVSFTGNKATYDKWDVRRYIAYLREAGYSSNYIKTAWYALKLFYESKDLDWDFKRSDTPKLERDEVKKIVMPPDDVKKLILYTKVNGFPEEKVILALSTTYGLRRAEIASIRNENLDTDTILIKTKKHGETRRHLIPSEIAFIKNFNYDKKMPSVSTISTIFDNLCLRAKIKRQFRQGIHSLRRSLVVALTDAGIPELTMKNFLRWRVRRDIAQEYYRPDYRKVDTLIFSKHPFLKYWR